MSVRQASVRVFAIWIVASSLTLKLGCFSYLHPVPPPQPEMLECCRSIPKAGKSHVYIFLMNGLDPVNCANLTGVRDFLLALGFNKTYYGQLYHYYWYKSEVCKIHQ